MKRHLVLSILSLISLSACQGAMPTALAPRSLQAANARTAAAAPLARQTAEAQQRYSYRKPVATMKIDLYHSADRPVVNELIKEFFAKYVDENDMVNYQLVDQNGNADIFFVNIFGGNQDFALKRLLPDLKIWLSQRSRFDNVHFYSE